MSTSFKNITKQFLNMVNICSFLLTSYKRDKVNQGKIYINGNTNIVELLLNIISL